MTTRAKDPPWARVVFAAELPACDCCDEPWCPVHNEHFGECACPGPTQDDLEYRTRNGRLECRPMSKSKR